MVAELKERVAREMRGLKALIVETAFPNRLDALARVSGHLTPEMLRREIDKMPPDIPIWIFHIKPQLFQETAEQLATTIGGSKLVRLPAAGRLVPEDAPEVLSNLVLEFIGARSDGGTF